MTEKDNTLDVLIGKKLRQVRKAKRLSQSHLGDAFGISFQQVQKYENGKNRIAASRLLQFAIHLGEPIEYFLTDAAAHLSGKPLAKTQADQSRSQAALIQNYGRLVLEIEDPAFRKAVISLIRRHLHLMKGGGG